MSDVREDPVNLDDDERPRGILGTAGRQFVRGEKKYEHRQTRYDRRQTMKERIENSVLDLLLLADEADDDLLREVMPDYAQHEDLERGLAGAIGFVFRTTALDHFTETLGTGAKNDKFAELLKQGVRGGYFNYDHIVDEFDYRVTSTHVPDISTLKAKAKADEELSPALIHYALTHDMVDDDAIQETVKEQLKELPDDS